MSRLQARSVDPPKSSDDVMQRRRRRTDMFLAGWVAGRRGGAERAACRTFPPQCGQSTPVPKERADRPGEFKSNRAGPFRWTIWARDFEHRAGETRRGRPRAGRRQRARGARPANAGRPAVRQVVGGDARRKKARETVRHRTPKESPTKTARRSESDVPKSQKQRSSKRVGSNQRSPKGG